MSVSLRPAITTDAGPAGAICYTAFKTIADQHGFPPAFATPDVATALMEHLLSRSEIHGVVAEADGRVCGSNFLWEADELAGVGPITVDPNVQNGSVGRRLMEAVLERARRQGIPAVRLMQAAYHGRSLSLYAKLGFMAREPLAVLQGKALECAIAGHDIRAATCADTDAANTQRRAVPLGAGTWASHGAADDADEPRALPRTAGRLSALDTLLNRTYTTPQAGLIPQPVKKLTFDHRELIAVQQAPNF